MENYIEQCKIVRKLTMAPMKDIAAALLDTKGDVDKAVELLVQRKATSAEDMANRKADNNIVYSYVHNNKVGAMIVLACQTDFVAKNALFLQLAKDICMHIVSSPNTPEYVAEAEYPALLASTVKNQWRFEVKGKPEAVVEKIVEGKFNKVLDSTVLLRQKFVRDDTITIQQLIANVSGTVGEKIEVKRFTRFSA